MALLSQTKSAGTGSSDSSFGTVAWTTPTRIVSSNDSDAIASSTTPFTSEYLKSASHGFTIPSDAQVVGILMQIERAINGSLDPVEDERIRLVKDGVVQSTDKAVAGNWTGSDTTVNYGGETDLWGTSWGAAEINDADFGVVVSVISTDTAIGSAIAAVDHIQITVYYYLPPISRSWKRDFPNVRLRRL